MGFRKPLLAVLLCALMAVPGMAQDRHDTGLNPPPAPAASKLLAPVSAGQVAEVCLNPTVATAVGYGTNYVVSNYLAFPNAFPPSGGGAIQSVYVNTAEIETMGFTFSPFVSQPVATTWTDNQAASISALDKPLVRGAIALTGSSVLGTHTTASAAQIGQAMNTAPPGQPTNPTPTTLYGILTTNGSLTNNFIGAKDLTICVDVVQFP